MSKTYKVEVQELLSRIVEVQADDFEEAVSKVRKKYQQEEIVLDYSDWISTEIEAHILPRVTRVDTNSAALYIHKLSRG